jgi:futalosine hydrolase
MTRVLLLVPTAFELRLLQPRIENLVSDPQSVVANCGFGPIAAGINTARLLQQHQPGRVILAGIAGAFAGRLAIGTAVSFSQIGCYGIGAGSGSCFRTASELGWNQWSESDQMYRSEIECHGDVITLGTSKQHSSALVDHNLGMMLLTVCAASADEADASDKLRLFPNAAAEDMEAWSVAMACCLHGTPLTVIRGISNVAGVRDKSRWNTQGALAAVADVLLSQQDAFEGE